MTAVAHRRALLVVAAALLWAAPQAHANVVDIVWNAAGKFDRSLTVAPGKFAEVCGAMQTGQSVQWRFAASRAMDFNIHFHVGHDVRYPARADAVRRSQGTLAVDSAQDYCWMWSNKSPAAARLQIRLRRR
jgi:hypothetical protein